MTETLLTNARLVLADRVVDGTLAIRDGVIADVSEGRTQRPDALDCEGDIVLPGLIELHTDNLERHIMPRPEAYWPADAAVMGHDREIAAAGITTVFNALCVGEVHSRSMRVQLLNEMSDAIEAQMAAGALKADHYFHWRCEISFGGMLDLLEPLLDYPAAPAAVGDGSYARPAAVHGSVQLPRLLPGQIPHERSGAAGFYR